MDLYNLLCSVLSAEKRFEKGYVPGPWNMPLPEPLDILSPLYFLKASIYPFSRHLRLKSGLMCSDLKESTKKDN